MHILLYIILVFVYSMSQAVLYNLSVSYHYISFCSVDEIVIAIQYSSGFMLATTRATTVIAGDRCVAVFIML